MVSSLTTKSLFNQPTGLMFHHFHGGTHPAVQGSIDSKQFRDILELIDLNNLIDADKWIEFSLLDKLKYNHSCVTFDDALLCQFDIAKPVLDDLNIKAFWFVYTSIFEGVLEKLEIYRHFRSTEFSSIDLFYDEFFSMLEQRNDIDYYTEKNKFNTIEYLNTSPFYSANDRWFRFLRDVVLGEKKYTSIMEDMLDKFNYDRARAADTLWINKAHLKQLSKEGHVIGLHSHTHPTVMKDLSPSRQLEEYSANYGIIESICGIQPNSMSHPCNSYNDNTLEVLTKLKIQIGFRADVDKKKNTGKYEFPREDHANLLGLIR